MIAILPWLAASVATQHPVETITVHNRFAYIVCTGVCTDSDLTVQSDGIVKFRVRSVGNPRWRSFQYRVSQNQVREFWSAFAKIRPLGLDPKGPIGNCVEDSKIIDKDISWADSAGRSRLLACWGVEEVRSTYYEGFRILRISPVTGERLTPEAAETMR